MTMRVMEGCANLLVLVISPPGLGLSIEHSVANGPGNSDLSEYLFAARLAPDGSGEDVAIFFGNWQDFSPGEKTARWRERFVVLL